MVEKIQIIGGIQEFSWNHEFGKENSKKIFRKYLENSRKELTKENSKKIFGKFFKNRRSKKILRKFQENFGKISKIFKKSLNQKSKS